MSDRDRLDDATLEALFTQARDAAPLPSDRLIARVLADARSVQDEIEAGRAAAARAAPVQAAARPGWLAALGGWGGMAGLTAAGLAGLTIGLFPPEGLSTLSATLTTNAALAAELGDSVALAGAFDAVLEEE